MRYRIEYAGNRCCNFANSRNDLLEWLKILSGEVITDIRKLYKSGVSDSVMEKYEKYIYETPAGGAARESE
ncbi:MAG: hypothetical protein ACRDBO_04515 [Lachnospiraceae bacterium]